MRPGGFLPERLFKYQAPTTQAISNVRDAVLWFSAPSAFNDPFDCALSIFEPKLTDGDYQRAYEREIQRRGNLVTRTIGSSGATNPRFRAAIDRALANAFDSVRQSHLKDRGVACFSETGDDLLMWSHYGQGHRGFCVEFDCLKEPFCEAKAVEYPNQVPRLNPIDLLDGSAPKGVFERAMLLTKAPCWSYEREWRLVHEHANERVRYPADALTGIYLGCVADSNTEATLASLARARGIPLHRIQMARDSFSLVSVPVP